MSNRKRVYTNIDFYTAVQGWDQKTRDFFKKQGIDINKVQGRTLLARAIVCLEPKNVVKRPRTRNKKLVVEYELK